MEKAILYAGLATIVLISGCSTLGPKPVDPGHIGMPFSIDNSPSNPSPSGSIAKKVVIFDVDDGDFPAAKQAGLGLPIRDALDTKISNAGGRLVDRKLATELKEEIERAEMAGNKGTYRGAPVSDYAVRAHIAEVIFDSEFIEASTWKDDGKQHRRPPHCRYTSRVKVTVDIYSVPELDRTSLHGEGSESTSEETRSSECNRNSTSLLRKASEEAVTDVQEELQGFFAPAGSVTKAFSYKGDDSLVALKTTLTRGLGAKPGSKVKIYTVTIEGDRYEVASGEIGEPVVNSGAVVLINKADAHKVKIGDEVKIDYACPIWGCGFNKSLKDTYDRMTGATTESIEKSTTEGIEKRTTESIYP